MRPGTYSRGDSDERDHVFAYVRVAVSQQPVDPGAGAGVRCPAEQLQQDRLFGRRQAGPVQQVERDAGHERVAGRLPGRDVEQVYRPDPAPPVQAAAEVVDGFHRVLGYHWLPLGRWWAAGLQSSPALRMLTEFPSRSSATRHR